MPTSTTIKVIFDVPAHIIYKLFVEQHSICSYTRCASICDPRPGGRLVMFDGMIEGEYVSLEENKCIEMKWRFKDWPAFADLTIRFENVGSDACEIILDYRNIPDTDTFGGPVSLEKL